MRGFLNLALLGAAFCNVAGAQADFTTVERFVPHTSTVRVNKGERVGIFLHEKLTRVTAEAIGAGRSSGGVVLFIHGTSVPSVVGFDLEYKRYSWMESLAEAGFDTFSMDHTGYGFSPRPAMGDRCNMDAANQAIVTLDPSSQPCEPKFAETLTTLESDWAEIDSVVDYLRGLRGVDRVHLIGWSFGGPRAGGYAARHPEKVDKLILFAPVYDADAASTPPAGYPQPAPPMRLQTREALMQGRWESTVACESQVDPGIRDVIWRNIMGFDALGSVWGPPEGVMRVRTFASWGWNAEYAAKISAPVLILVGEQDGLLPSADALFRDLTGTRDKVLVRMVCATHFAVWEATQAEFMHEASIDWLTSGELRGRSEGVVSVERSDTAP
ncbi:MAG TPA: alpha/beta hydrolase [Gammaproteobacteria bacterium]